MKGLISLFVVLVVVSMDVQAAVNSCLRACEDKQINCLSDPNRCFDQQSCEANCSTPYKRCKGSCPGKREVLSKFFQDDGREG